MKGKDIFTKEEYKAIVRLLKSKVRSDKSGKKSIRAKIRKFGFHCSDFKNNAGDEFNVNDFKQLVKSGKITIIGGNGGCGHISEGDKSLLSERRFDKTNDQKIESMKNCACLEAYVPASSRILILGNMPGKESLRLQQYYANRSNRFCKIIAKVTDKTLPEDYSKRLRLLDQLHIALWDVYASAERKGSLDSNIKNGEQNDVQSLINSNPSIKKVLFNGGKAYKKALDYGCLNVEMPSTSSANTHLTQEELFSIWVKGIKEQRCAKTPMRHIHLKRSWRLWR